MQSLLEWCVKFGAHAGLFSVGKNPVPTPQGVSYWNAPFSRFGRAWGWSPDLYSRLSTAIEEFSPDIIHIHGAWWAAQVLAATIAGKQRIPFVLSFHGMLEPYHWSEGGGLQFLRKRIYSDLFSFPRFREATLIHAITAREADNIRKWYPNATIRTIPNAVNLDAIENELSSLPPVPRQHAIGFLGRLHQKKGVDKLITAFRDANLGPDWRLDIAGPEENLSYVRALKAMAAAGNGVNEINFLGPIFGRRRWDLLRTSWVIVAPSRSEVIAMVNLEAAACKTPSITTYETGLTDWPAGGGSLVGLEGNQLCETIRFYCSLDEATLSQRGEASLRLVRSRYSWEYVSDLWRELYETSIRIGPSRPVTA